MTLNELFDIYIEDVDMINQVTTTDSIKYRYKSHFETCIWKYRIRSY